MSKYFYLDISLEFADPKNISVDAVTFKNFICTALKTLFGDCGASITVDLLKYDQKRQRGVIRCPAKEETAVPTFIAGEICCTFHYFPSIQLPNMPKSITVGKSEKDTVLFVSKSEHLEPSSIFLPKPDSQKSLILSNGEINWMCPCLDGMATGPCGVEFRDAFECYHFSMENPQGKDCLRQFHSMQACMQRHPETYRREDKPLKSSKQDGK